MKVSINNLIVWVIGFFVILSHSLYAYLSYSMIPNIIYGVLSVLPILYLGLNRICIHNKNKVICFLCLYYGLMCFYFCSNVSIQDYLSFICRYFLFVPAMMFVFIDLIQKRKALLVFKYISNVMYAVAIISLLLWTLGTTFRILPSTGVVNLDWGNAPRNTYFGMYLEVPGRLLGTFLNRNCGLFCESPAFAVFLGIALGHDILIANINNRFRIVILVLTLLSTGTTTSFLVFLYLIIARIWVKTNRKKSKDFLIRILFVFFGIVGAFGVFKVMMMDSKLYSVNLRILDYVNGVELWLKRPFIGYGYMYVSSSDTPTGFSNGITPILVSGGLIFFSVYIIPFLKSIIFSLKKHEYRILYWSIFYGIIFSISIVGYAYISLLFVAFWSAYTLECEQLV